MPPAPIWLNNSLIGKCSLIRPAALPDRSAKTVGIVGALTFVLQHRNLLFLRSFQYPHEVLRGEIRTHWSGPPGCSDFARSSAFRRSHFSDLL